MFKAVQYYDTSGKPLDRLIERDIYAVDRATDSFMIVDFTGQFTWIPSWTCRAYSEEDCEALKKQGRDMLKECYQTAYYAMLNETRRRQLNSKG